MPIYPLGTIMELVESVSTGSVPMKVSYAYDDLVFMEHNAFLFQFTPELDKVLLHKNIDAKIGEIEEPIAVLKAAAAGKGITINDGSLYRIEQADDQNVSIQFIKKEQDAQHDRD